MPDFRVYYHDRPPYSGDPFEAPAFGVLCIVEPDETSGRHIVSNGDYYGWDWELRRWFPFDYIGMVDYLQRPGPKRVLFGRLVSDEDWTRVYKQADTDPDFPKRTNGGRGGRGVKVK